MRYRLGIAALVTSAVVATSASPAPLPESGTLDLGRQDDVTISGTGDLSDTGWTVSPAGDVNGDGKADVLIGARLAGQPGRDAAGAAYVVFGGRGKSKIDLSKLGGDGFRIDG